MTLHPDIKPSISQSVTDTLNSLRELNNLRAMRQIELSIEDANSWMVENDGNPRNGRVMAERILRDAMDKVKSVWGILESDPNSDGELDTPAYERIVK